MTLSNHFRPLRALGCSFSKVLHCKECFKYSNGSFKVPNARKKALSTQALSRASSTHRGLERSSALRAL